MNIIFKLMECGISMMESPWGLILHPKWSPISKKHLSLSWIFMLRISIKVASIQLKNSKLPTSFFFQAHDIKLVNDDFGEGLYHADNTFSYDLSPVSSSNGFLNWASKTFRNYFGQFSHVVDAFVYTIVVLVSFFFMLHASKLQKAFCVAIQRA